MISSTERRLILEGADIMVGYAWETLSHQKAGDWERAKLASERSEEIRTKLIALLDSMTDETV